MITEKKSTLTKANENIGKDDPTSKAGRPEMMSRASQSSIASMVRKGSSLVVKHGKKGGRELHDAPRGGPEDREQSF